MKIYRIAVITILLISYVLLYVYVNAVYIRIYCNYIIIKGSYNCNYRTLWEKRDYINNVCINNAFFIVVVYIIKRVLFSRYKDVFYIIRSMIDFSYTYIYSYTHIHAQAHMHIYAREHIHTHIRTHIYINFLFTYDTYVLFT